MAVISLPAFHVTGPVHHFIRTPQEEPDIWFLGTAEVTPKVEHRVMQADTFNDIGGSMVPMQRTAQGEMAVIGTLLNRFSKGAVDLLNNLSAQPLAAGFEGRFSRGPLVFGVSSFELWLLFDFATNPAFRSPGLEMGYYFPQCVVGGKTRDRLGTDTEKFLLVAEAYPFWVPQASANSISGFERAWQLYANDDASFDLTQLVPQ